ncbi:hypothetical protein TNCV_3709171 [Trichonephila clavipes]|nr:hypothetical protein TNCV_3709171 [Trichonephila clavipes]
MPAMIRYLDHWTTAEPEIVVRDQFIYMDDSTLPHKVTVVEDLLKEAGMVWTTKKPDHGLLMDGSRKIHYILKNLVQEPFRCYNWLF